MSYLGDMNIVGKLISAAGAFRRLCVDDDGVRSNWLNPRKPKCGVFGGDKELVDAEATKLPTGRPPARRLHRMSMAPPTPLSGVQRR